MCWQLKILFNHLSFVQSCPPYFSRPQPDTVAILPVKSSLSRGMQMGTICSSNATGDSSSRSARSFANVAGSYCLCTMTRRTFFVTERRDSSSPLMSNSPNTATRFARNLNKWKCGSDYFLLPTLFVINW